MQRPIEKVPELPDKTWAGMLACQHHDKLDWQFVDSLFRCHGVPVSVSYSAVAIASTCCRYIGRLMTA